MRYRECWAAEALRLADQPSRSFVSSSANFIGFENKTLRGFASQKPFRRESIRDLHGELKVQGLPCVGVDTGFAAALLRIAPRTLCPKSVQEILDVRVIGSSPAA